MGGCYRTCKQKVSLWSFGCGVVLERTMRVKVIIRGLCDGDSRMLISQPLSLTTILFRTTIIRTCRLHNQLLISNLSLYWKENLQVCYYSVLSFLQNLFLQLSGSWHLRKHTNKYFFLGQIRSIFYLCRGEPLRWNERTRSIYIRVAWS